jgi:hypothetical protein
VYRLKENQLLTYISLDTLLQPYVIISQQDGSELEKVPLTIPAKLRYPQTSNADGTIVFYVFNEQIQRSGDEFLLSDMATDTIFSFNKDGILTPRITRSPPVQKMDSKMTLFAGVECGRFTFFATKHFGDASGIPEQNLAYDRRTKQIVSPRFFDADYFPHKEINRFPIRSVSDISDRWMVVGLPADELFHAFARGELQGRLKEVASTVKEGDNPLLMLIRFKD